MQQEIAGIKNRGLSPVSLINGFAITIKTQKIVVIIMNAFLKIRDMPRYIFHNQRGTK